MLFTCLHRSRMAKGVVMNSFLKRKINDGKWHCEDDVKAVGLSIIRNLREKIQEGASEQVVINDALEYFDVHYDQAKRCHVLEHKSPGDKRAVFS